MSYLRISYEYVSPGRPSVAGDHVLREMPELHHRSALAGAVHLTLRAAFEQLGAQLLEDEPLWAEPGSAKSNPG